MFDGVACRPLEPAPVPLDRRPDPADGVGGELEALAGVEHLDGAGQADDTGLEGVVAVVGLPVACRPPAEDPADEAEVVGDHLRLLGGQRGSHAATSTARPPATSRRIADRSSSTPAPTTARAGPGVGGDRRAGLRRSETDRGRPSVEGDLVAGDSVPPGRATVPSLPGVDQSLSGGHDAPPATLTACTEPSVPALPPTAAPPACRGGRVHRSRSRGRTAQGASSGSGQSEASGPLLGRRHRSGDHRSQPGPGLLDHHRPRSAHRPGRSAPVAGFRPSSHPTAITSGDSPATSAAAIRSRSVGSGPSRIRSATTVAARRATRWPPGRRWPWRRVPLPDAAPTGPARRAACRSRAIGRFDRPRVCSCCWDLVLCTLYFWGRCNAV